jgi:uncharacterized integral membrane protein
MAVDLHLLDPRSIITLAVGRSRMKPKLILGGILAGVMLVFIIQNATVINLSFLFWTLSMSGALLMLLILSVGIILGWLLYSFFSRRKSHTGTVGDVMKVFGE